MWVLLTFLYIILHFSTQSHNLNLKLFLKNTFPCISQNFYIFAWHSATICKESNKMLFYIFISPCFGMQFFLVYNAYSLTWKFELILIAGCEDHCKNVPVTKYSNDDHVTARYWDYCKELQNARMAITGALWELVINLLLQHHTNFE